ncbi:MAG: exopolysaccharide biosynthesis polyprenyl glycosylphosphotransferase [bacterium]|nr:exopolysaccharide biosynthesis polyprenyl glycosylphosphotransferase [bacterium]
MKEDAAAFAVVDGEYAVQAPAFFIPADTTRYAGPQALVKRFFDLTVSGILLLLTAPLMGLIALLIKQSSPGPVFFVQERLGKDGKPFKFYKFRSMKHNSDDAIHRQFAAMFINGDERGCAESNSGEKVFKLKEDPRVTGIGSLLRRTSLDELPQLINIVRGEMSLVGPRPPIAYEIENYLPWHMERLRAVPGLTGLWQVSGRSSVSFDEMVHMDIRYISNWSLWRDVMILLKTVPVVLRGTGGY